MAFDIEMIKKVYDSLPGRIAAARQTVGRPLTLAEKVLYAHLHSEQPLQNFERAKTYVNFTPDRVAMQDATAQMALLQFMQAGRPAVAAVRARTTACGKSRPARPRPRREASSGSGFQR